MINLKLSSILKMAIDREIEAHDFYTYLAEEMTDATLKETLIFLAQQEKKHQQFLEGYTSGIQAGSLNQDTVIDYKIAEHLEEPKLAAEPKPEEVYLTAAHKELKAYKFYTELADMHDDGEAKQLLIKIANEELKHKEKVEYLYSNTAFAQIAGG